jgi:putative MATE family efflux protein
MALAKEPQLVIGAEQEPTQAELRRSIVRLALPAVAEQVLMTLVSMADMIQVGGLGAAAITAVGLSNQPMFTAMAIFSAISVGSTALIARQIGARDFKGANEAAKQSFVLAIVASTLLSLLVVVTPYPVLAFFHADPEVVHYAVGYIQIAGVSMIFQLASVILTGVLRGAGDMRTPMIVNTVANLINVVGNWLLINGIWIFPRLEVAGAAWATLLSRLVAFIMVLRVFFSGKFVLHVTFKNGYRPNFDILKRIFVVGLPAAAEQIIMRLGMIFYAKAVSDLGTIVYAAHQVAINAESLSYTPAMGFAMAATPLVGQSLGANKRERAMRFGLETRKIAMCLSTIMGVVLLAFPAFLTRLYTSDPEVIRQAVLALRIIAFFEPVEASVFVMMGALRGSGDTRYVMYVTLAGVWLVRDVLAYVLVVGFGLGLAGAWAAMAADMTVRSFLSTRRFRTGRWQDAKV